MPTIDSIVPEVTKQCIEVVSEQITNRLIDHLGFSNIFLYNDNLFIHSDDLRSSIFDDSSNNIRAQNNRCDVKILPGYDALETKFDIISGRVQDTTFTSPRWTTGDYPIFSDKRANVFIAEIALPSVIELQFTIKLKSIELSDALNTALFSRALTNGGISDYNDIQFSYGFPDKILLLLYKIYNMQDDLKAEMTFKEYLRFGSNDGITGLMNRSRPEGDVEIIYQKNNSKVLGRLEYSGDKHETEDFNKVSNRYVINFSYFLQYSRPTILRTVYPIMVYNKVIDKQYVVPQQKNMSYGEGNQYITDRALNHYFLKQKEANLCLERSYPLVRYPFFDDWQRSPTMYKDVNEKYMPIFIGLLSIDIATDNTLSLSVDMEKEIFPLLSPSCVVEMKKVIQEFQLEKDTELTFNDLFKRLGIFDISVFSNDNIIKFDRLTLSDEYVLTIAGPLDITKLYRLVISQIKEIRILNRNYIYYMLQHPDFYADYLAFHMTYLVENGYVNIITDTFTGEKSAIAEIRKKKPALWINTPNNAIIINNYVVEARRIR